MSENANTSMNGTQPSSRYNPTAEKIGKTFAYCLILLVSLAGNTSIVIIVYKTKTMRKSINFLVVNMAMSDLLYPIFVIPRIVTELYVDSWLISSVLGQAMCKLVHFFQDISAVVSIESLALIAVDRFGAVVFPLRCPFISSKLCPFFILATWMVAMAIHSPDVMVFKLVESPGGLACATKWNEVFGESSSIANYYLALTVIIFYIPLVLIAILYVIIYYKLKAHTIPGEQSVVSAAEQQRVKRERNVLNMAIAIVLGFVVCWVPFSIIIILYYYAWPKSFICGMYYISSIAKLMSRANCAVNPSICFMFSGNYQQGLKKLFSFRSTIQPAPNQVGVQPFRS